MVQNLAFSEHMIPLLQEEKWRDVEAKIDLSQKTCLDRR